MTALRKIARAACLSASLLAGAVPCANALEEGKPAPHFEIATADCKTFNSSEARSEVIVVHLWATWCPFCREEMPALETFYQRHKAEGLKMIAVSMDEAGEDGKAREIMRAFHYTDGIGRLSNLNGFGRIWRLPMTFVIDRHGILRRDGSDGDPKIDLASLEKLVTPLLQADSAQRRP